jgi:hypothetical protein
MQDFVHLPHRKQKLVKKRFSFHRIFSVVGVILLAAVSTVISWAYQSNFNPKVELASLQNDMAIFEKIYQQRGRAISDNKYPFLLSAQDALRIMYNQIITDGTDDIAEEWQYTSMYIVGQEYRFMVAAVSEQACALVLESSGSALLHADGSKEGLIKIAKSGKVDSFSCLRQGWEGGISQLYSAFNHNALPGAIHTHLIFKRLPQTKKMLLSI